MDAERDILFYSAMRSSFASSLLVTNVTTRLLLTVSGFRHGRPIFCLTLIGAACFIKSSFSQFLPKLGAESLRIMLALYR